MKSSAASDTDRERPKPVADDPGKRVGGDIQRTMEEGRDHPGPAADEEEPAVVHHAPAGGQDGGAPTG